jgi:hypothetical protein
MWVMEEFPDGLAVDHFPGGILELGKGHWWSVAAMFECSNLYLIEKVDY